MRNRYYVLPILLLFMSIFSFAQNYDLPEPQMADSTGGPNPPPPGLVVSIDESSHLLVAAGIVLGIFLIKKKKD